ncbi:helix-turn-helix domain-containing protein [Clostridium thermobutyricum]|uniref:helix-turn-helix domain-containing protein n=1 Tax=Clostridium thermobutyricum TaxID=29372 RepID=UPI0018A955B4|nr:helix-turn-helix transcriptional regulator [Clostridium thermobutyricum]
MFCQRLKEYRIRFNFYYQKDFAEYLNINQSTYSKYESGNKNPTEEFIEILNKKTGLPKWYWRYGINEFEFINLNKIMKKCINDMKLNERDFTNKEYNLIISAFRDDLKHEINKRNNIISK